MLQQKNIKQDIKKRLIPKIKTVVIDIQHVVN